MRNKSLSSGEYSDSYVPSKNRIWINQLFLGSLWFFSLFACLSSSFALAFVFNLNNQFQHFYLSTPVVSATFTSVTLPTVISTLQQITSDFPSAATSTFSVPFGTCAGTIEVDGTPLREQSNPDSTTLEILRSGDRVAVIKRTGDRNWLQIYNGHITGWSSANFISLEHGCADTLPTVVPTTLP